MDRFFRVAIRVVFLVAYGAFLWASLHHISYFFASFEPGGSDGFGSYALAISIDVTALVMTIGVMFFRKSMSWFSFAIVWAFIIGLTAFSWTVNWEYAVQFQNTDLSRATQFQMVNPILASSFAFLNLVYSLVGEFFDTKQETAADLDKEIERLTSVKARRETLKQLRKGTGFIATVTDFAKDTKQAVSEVFTTPVQEPLKEHDTGPIVNPLATDEVLTNQAESEHQETPLSEVEQEALEHTEDTPGEIPIVSIEKHKKAPARKQPTNASQRVYNVLKSFPDASITVLANKAKVSRGYASRIRSQWQSEQLQSA